MDESPMMPSHPLMPRTEAMPPTVAMAGTTTPRNERTNRIRNRTITKKPVPMRIAHSRVMTSFSSISV